MLTTRRANLSHLMGQLNGVYTLCFNRRQGKVGHVFLVDANRDTPLWSDALRQQMYLADEAFVQRMHAQAGATALQCAEVPRRQRPDPTTLSGWLAACDSRDQSM